MLFQILCIDCSASRLPKAAASSSNDFDEFNKQTDDAWDGGDDDLLLEAFNVRISRRDVQSAATQVSGNLLILENSGIKNLLSENDVITNGVCVTVQHVRFVIICKGNLYVESCHSHPIPVVTVPVLTPSSIHL